MLHDEVVDYAIPGIELVSILGTGIKFLDPLEIYAPKQPVTKPVVTEYIPPCHHKKPKDFAQN